jgi:ATP-dependent DNA helicase RecG
MSAIGPGSPIETVKGVGPSTARTLSRAGIVTLGDLLAYLPYRYEDRSNPRTIASLGNAEGNVTVTGRIVHLAERRSRNRRLRIVEGIVDDGTGALPLVWFNQPYLTGSLGVGRRVWLYGPLKPARVGWGRQLVSPEWELEDQEDLPVHLGRVVPMYRRIGSFSGRRIRSLIARVLEDAGVVEDPLAPFLPADLALPSRSEALRFVHFPAPHGADLTPPTLEELTQRRSPAHRRLAFEELLALAVVLEREKGRRRSLRAVRCVVTDATRERARATLPFHLTGAQRRVLGDIVADLQRPFPMARLLQGDVGSGKTIVAVLAALVVLESGFQVALLAPTELLAQQHHATLTRLLSPTDWRPELLIGSLPDGQKRTVRQRLATGETALVVGTHALIQESVRLPHLGLVVIDEQHRFGVAQRQALVDKGEAPHLLVMSATPIPRSLALSLYGDLDVTVLDELPPGRSPVRTVVRDDAARRRLAAFLRRETGDGAQVYWVVPLIEDSEKVSLRALATHVRTVRAALPGVAVGVVHGRLPAAEREAVMAEFASGRLPVLCATTVIEVGVDVANASVMVIENAEHFGLAQLHQLRGRVGRGRRRSFCVLLLGEGCAGEALRRVQYFAATADGFAIAEEDFRLRGPGELTGLRQWGRPAFRVANLASHRRELEAARRLAAAAQAHGRLEELAGAAALLVGFAGSVGTG